MSQKKTDIRPAGTGLIFPDQPEYSRGKWILYDTTASSSIGAFDVSFWIEPKNDYSIEPEDLKSLARFIQDNVRGNIIVLEFSHEILLGGTGSGKTAAKEYLKSKRKGKSRNGSELVEGYEIRLHISDATVFLMLWNG